MIHLLADENIPGLAQFESDELSIKTVAGRDLTARDLTGIDALWVRSVTRVGASLLAAKQRRGDCPLRFVGTATAGTEHIDIALLQSLGIPFAAAPGANANSVVEYVIAALLELRTPWVLLSGGGSLGVVGYGEVGKRLVAFAEALGWTLRVYDPWQAAAQKAGTTHDSSAPRREFHSLGDVLGCDVISLHCSLHARTPWPSFHLIDERALSRLGSAQWLINAARGPVIDNTALLANLRGPGPVNCVLDVWEGEPRFSPALLQCAALKLATPHIAGYSLDAKLLAARMLHESMREAQLLQRKVLQTHYALPELQSCAGGVDGLRQLVQQRYCIADDDRRMRALADLPDAARAHAFDTLRRDYPVRRELRGSVLVSEPHTGSGARLSDSSQLLAALGVRSGLE